MPWEVIYFLFCFAPFFYHWAWPRLLSPSLLMFWKLLASLQYLCLTEEVVYFLLLFLWCAALSICCVCYAELRPAMVVLVNTHRPLCRSSLLFLFVATVVAFLTCVTFILVSWWFSYFALHLVSWPLSLTGFSHGVLRLQVSTFLALYVCSIVLYFVLPSFF